MAAKFPARRLDGSFSVEIFFESNRPFQHEVLEKWLAHWITTNREWIRKWQGESNKVVKIDVMKLSDTFICNPYLTILTPNTVTIRLDATAEAPFWKDWMVKLIEEAVERFPCLKFKGVKGV